MTKLEIVNETLNLFSQIAFLTYALMTMARINAYIKSQERKGNKT